MYFFYLDLILNEIERMKRTSIVFYTYNSVKNKFNLVINSHKTHATHFCLLVYIFLLLISGFFGMYPYSILQKVLCLSFVGGRLGLYSLFNIVTTSEVLRDAVDLLNKMLKFETGLMNCSTVGELPFEPLI